MILFISLVSFLCDGLLSKYLHATVFLPLLTITSLVIIFPYFNKNHHRFLKYIAIMGILYDICYANTLLYNFFIFLIIGYLIMVIDYIFSNSLYITIVANIVCIIFYRVINMLFLIIFHGLSFSFPELLKSIYSSLLLNIIFCILGYILTKKYSVKHKILRSV